MYIGCSGYYYPEWRLKFYPKGVPASRWLEYYSRVFNTVELNGTFYRLPKPADLVKKAVAVPDDFVFAVKASRYITHILRMKNAARPVEEMLLLLEGGLGKKLAKILFQLPASFTYSEENLSNVCVTVPEGNRFVIEFRHASWWNETAIARFRERQYTFCNVDYPGLQPPFVQTSGAFYLRLHGVPELFRSSYSAARLQQIAAKLPAESDCHVYFNNTAEGAAFANAQHLQRLMHGHNYPHAPGE